MTKKQTKSTLNSTQQIVPKIPINSITAHTHTSSNFTQPTSPGSDDDMERDVFKKEDSLKKLKELIKKNNIKKLTEFLSDKNNKYILHDAVEENEADLVDKILELAPYLTKVTYNSSTVLHSATRGIASDYIVNKLRKVDPNLENTKDKENKTPSEHVPYNVYNVIEDYLKIEAYLETKIMGNSSSNTSNISNEQT
ncbi:MAG TPA: hypothetical protein LFW21_04520 [Rickettsia endosymbiont of Pyrocoelia pectoralis]|nr:hypothetical protein [Rickettsia endosymbiont of Pyrocoelia pectoralis]